MKWAWPQVSEKLQGLWERYKYALLVVLVGVVLLLWPSGERPGGQTAGDSQSQTLGFDVEEMERKLEQALSRIQGAGEVTVVLTLRGGERQILAQDVHSDNGEVERSTVVISQGSGVQQTVPLQQLYPQYQGALVICSGGDDPAVRLELLTAMRALTGLGGDKISICKG